MAREQHAYSTLTPSPFLLNCLLFLIVGSALLALSRFLISYHVLLVRQAATSAFCSSSFTACGNGTRRDSL